MKKQFKLIISAVLLSIVFMTGYALAMEGNDMDESEKIGDLIHESVIDGYVLSHYFMDLRDQKTASHADDTKIGTPNLDKEEMDKPHHIMVYIMDKDHNPVLKGKVGFMIKDAANNKQTAMGMFMSKGFGTTADMKKKGSYTIFTKIVLENKILKDSFKYEIN
ncbi:MAG: hypothetical protein PF690_06285 [Deltaproteobacteria bacterium]|jgi:hypothetical protein|nr:hypothetical protein [Deltaproteobacteria bacterium]